MLSTSRSFLPRDASPAEARAWARSSLRSGGIAGVDVGDVLLVVSELVTNAVRHGSGAVDVELRVEGDAVGVGVHDSGRVFTPPPPGAPDGAGGRGLFLVAAISRQWGIEASASGKTVWARVPLPGPTR
ncbi:MAG TPA: ATP-binding protein [Acidimicrobiales bacterium]|jgi:anti-sigma regulatory factor (Ser/Thr protein kinase)